MQAAQPQCKRGVHDNGALAFQWGRIVSCCFGRLKTCPTDSSMADRALVLVIDDNLSVAIEVDFHFVPAVIEFDLPVMLNGFRHTQS